jgi:H+/Cl- antiporter ClcA
MIQKLGIWTCVIAGTGMIVGSSAAAFLFMLELATQTREGNPWLIYYLPLIGLIVSWLYLKINPTLSNGNESILKTYLQDAGTNNKIALALAPLVFIGTILTHLGGGSAGREGTAVQMGASISYQFNRWTNLNAKEQRLLLCIGVSAGFGAVFGTPIAASIFALEFFSFKKTDWRFIIPTLLTALVADWTTTQWGIQHAHYQIVPFHTISFQDIGRIGIAGMLFGLVAAFYIWTSDSLTNLFSRIKYQPLRAFIGGAILTLFFIMTAQEKMMGLGLSTIADAFIHQQGQWDFLIKLLLTCFALSAGFKGGEVTPLFFIGAVLGSSLISFIPLPISLLAGLGLIAVFAGATHCLLSSIVLGIELFGIEFALPIIIASAIAYLFSGSKNIYPGRPKDLLKEKLYAYFL